MNTLSADIKKIIAERISWDAHGLVPVVVQSAETSDVLMLAWMNPEALGITLSSGQMVYWSRSRGGLWRKGETSGQTQQLREMTLDCDGDTLLAKVTQNGVACHTGRRSCFFLRFENGGLHITLAPEIPPEQLYGKDHKK